MTLSRGDVLGLLSSNGVKPSRALGQNFVADPNTSRRVARLANVGPYDHVVEVGAGLGSLTLALAETGAAVIAVERDRWLAPIAAAMVAERAPGRSVRVVEADAMVLDWEALLAPAERWTLVANLPYNIATPLVADLLDGVPKIRRMTFMVQREVGERMVAAPGQPGFGAVSVKVAYWARASLLGTVPSSVFVPQPKVGSVLVGLVRRDQPAVDPAVIAPSELFAVVRAGFAHRRKMLRRALEDFHLPVAAFDEAGIDGEARAEQLSVEQWGRLSAVASRHAAAGGMASRAAPSRVTGKVGA